MFGYFKMSNSVLSLILPMSLLSYFYIVLITIYHTLYPVQFRCSVMSAFLWPHGLQHARLPCPSTTPGVYSNSCPLIRWCHPTISSSVIPFSLCLQSFPASGSFLMSQFFASGGQNTGVSASASVLPMNIQDWFPVRWLTLLAVQRTLKSLLQMPQFKIINSSVLSFLYSPTLTSIHAYQKHHSFVYMDLCWQSNVSAF